MTLAVPRSARLPECLLGAFRRSTAACAICSRRWTISWRGGDPRLTLDPISRLNDYGCGPAPAPQTLSFASSTASPISERGYERAGLAREELMRSAIALGLEEALDERIEAMREELKAHLALPRPASTWCFRRRAPTPSSTRCLSRARCSARADDDRRRLRPDRQRHGPHRARPPFQPLHRRRRRRAQGYGDRGARRRGDRAAARGRDRRADAQRCRCRRARGDRNGGRGAAAACCCRSWMPPSSAGARRRPPASTRSRGAGRPR